MNLAFETTKVVWQVKLGYFSSYCQPKKSLSFVLPGFGEAG